MDAALSASLRDAARFVAGLPAALAEQAGPHVEREVAGPLAAAIRSAAPQPWGSRLTVTTLPGVDPGISVGGQSLTIGGRARGVDVVYGLEFGGSAVRSLQKHRPYARNIWHPRPGPRHTVPITRTSVWRNTTAQFRPRRAFIFPTFAAQAETTFDAWIRVLDPFVVAWQTEGLIPT